MGTVYEALDPFINRKVALKTMIAGLADNAELKARFLREAQSAGGLRHRNIVTVYDLGEDKGQPYIAMEFIDGTDLEKVIQNREPLTVEWKLDILRQVCEGLAYAHKAGIVHRDIKPANVRVTNEGEVKIMDFGIAHLQSSTMTKSGLVLGTVHYMAPEQIEGQKVDHRADVFSVGAIAYELIAYKRPFDGDTITAVMYKIMHDRPDPKVLPDTEYSPRLQEIIMKALARDVRERYPSLDDMRHDLAGMVRATPTRVGLRVDPSLVRPAAPPRGAQPDRARPQAEHEKPPAEREKPQPDREKQQEIARMRAEVERARSEGQLQRAMVTCRRLLELAPGDQEAAALAKQVEAAAQDQQVAQLCETALGYAADGDMELAGKIMGKVEKLAPESARYRQLKTYLAEESARRAAKDLTATAQDHLAFGNLEEARAAAEQALAAQPSNTVAREIRDRAADILARRKGGAAPAAAAPAAAPEAARASAAATATPPPTAPPPVNAAPSPPAEPAAAAPVPPSDPGTSPRTGSPEGRRSEVEALTSAALNHFLQNNHAKARKAIDKALAIDPGNKKAREMLRILGALG
jgi:serine/threonine-protein kinase